MIVKIGFVSTINPSSFRVESGNIIQNDLNWEHFDSLVIRGKRETEFEYPGLQNDEDVISFLGPTVWRFI